MSKSSFLCPSGRCEADSKLLGIVQEDGRIGYLGAPLEIDETFIARAQEGRSPERRFRFTTPCIEGGCKHWAGTRCGVIDKMLEALDDVDEAALPKCGIRNYCRWFRQSGVAACHVCPLIITDSTAQQSG